MRIRSLDTSKYKLDQTDTEHQILTEYVTSGEDGEDTERTKTYTLENGSVSTNMPNISPVKNGAVFLGWKLVADDNIQTDDYFYQKNEEFEINDDSISYAKSNEESASDEDNTCPDFTFHFVAQWRDVSNESDKAIYSVRYYKEVLDTSESETPDSNNPHYALYYEAQYEGTVSETVAILDQKNPSSANGLQYELNDEKSTLVKTIVSEEDQDSDSDNCLKVYYDLKKAKVSIHIQTEGLADNTAEYPVTITLKDDQNNLYDGEFSGVRFKNGVNVKGITVSDAAELMIPVGFSIGIVEESPDSTYQISYKINDQTKEEAIRDHKIDGNLSIVIINNKDYIPETGLGNSDGGKSAFVLATVLLIVTAVFWWSKRYVRRE